MKEQYCAPTVEVLGVNFEGIICGSHPDGVGGSREDYPTVTW